MLVLFIGLIEFSSKLTEMGIFFDENIYLVTSSFG